MNLAPPTLALIAAFTLPCQAELIEVGSDIESASKAMASSGYRKGGRSIVHRDTISALAGLPEIPEDERGNLKMWSVGQGTLIISYIISTGVITHLTFSLCDERAKSKRKEFDFPVISFDSVSGKMEIETKLPAKERSSPAP